VVKFLAPAGTVAEFIWFADAKSYPKPFTLCGSCFFSCDSNSYVCTDSYTYAYSDAYVLTRRFAWSVDTGSAGRGRALRRLHG
jgi:hypothetical protein